MKYLEQLLKQGWQVSISLADDGGLPMLETEKQAVLKVINDLWAHDAWTWGNTCASLINHEIDFEKPAIVEIDGEYITANVYVKDGREFQIGYQEGGWWMCFVKDADDPRARLIKQLG